MCKKLISLALVVMALSIPVSAAPSAAHPLKVDLNGEGIGQTGRTQPGWEGWDFDRYPTTDTFIKIFSGDYNSVTVELKGISYDGTMPKPRKRSDQSSDELGKVHQDLFLVVTTASALGLEGLDYTQLSFAFGPEAANQTFLVTCWNWDSAFNEFGDYLRDDYAAWGIVNPSTNGGYHVTSWDDPCTPEDENGIYKCNVPTLARTWMFGMVPQDDPNTDELTFSSTFQITTDANGYAVIYGWYDGDSFSGSFHFPFNGFAIYTEPECLAPLTGDLNNDCKVDFMDFALFAQSWLECNLDPPEACEQWPPI